MKLTDVFSRIVNNQLIIWIAAAVILPISALAGMFFVWAFGTQDLINISMIVGATSMFVIAVIWWWWVMGIVIKLTHHYQNSSLTIYGTLLNIKEIKDILNLVVNDDKPK